MNSKLVGYLKLIEDEPPHFAKLSHAVHLERIYLLSQFQGIGIGKRLLRFSEKVAKELGYSNIWLGVWDENTDAINFYLRQGFQKVGSHDWEFKYKEIDYMDTDDVMVKHLS